jgi:hypothetical protein
MCDDDAVSPVHEEDVLKLSGGGDWHTAYLLLYAPRCVPILLSFLPSFHIKYFSLFLLEIIWPMFFQ